MFIRTNILIRMFHKYSFAVRTMLFKAYCLCMYDITLWTKFKAGQKEYTQPIRAIYDEQYY